MAQSLLAAYQNAPAIEPPLSALELLEHPPEPPMYKPPPPGQRYTREELRAAHVRIAQTNMKAWLERRNPSNTTDEKFMTEKQRADLKKCFNLLDSAKQGFLNHNQVSVAMKALGFSFEAIRRAILHEREADDDQVRPTPVRRSP